MINWIKNLLGLKSINLTELLNNGASIVDVRTVGEFAGGHVSTAVNIPLDQISKHIDKIKKMPQPIITCCASGLRSASAKSILKNNGIEAYNGGSWLSLNTKK